MALRAITQTYKGPPAPLVADMGLAKPSQYRGALMRKGQTITETEDVITQEELTKLQHQSAIIVSDPICDVGEKEVKDFLIPTKPPAKLLMDWLPKVGIDMPSPPRHSLVLSAHGGLAVVEVGSGQDD
ncbi:hypothetical protein FOZ62_020213 [Perkinsus olseni]|uniref:Uncharacterized protein n=1 Tax=Perkinsus olseni TaxID=32597 RepID=A0A7J6SDB9_PEROL|nr:hypothetical protein FOZ62_020213 [Perkinsus olseni]